MELNIKHIVASPIQFSTNFGAKHEGFSLVEVLIASSLFASAGLLCTQHHWHNQKHWYTLKQQEKSYIKMVDSDEAGKY